MRHSLVRRALPSLIAAVAGTLCVAGAAHGSVTIGQTAGASNCSGSNQVFVQKSVNAAPTYQAPSSGVVVKWSHLAVTGNANITLKVVHSTASASTWFVRSSSTQKTAGTGAGQVHPSQLNTFDESPGLPIQAGDVLGLTASGGTAMSCIA